MIWGYHYFWKPPYTLQKRKFSEIAKKGEKKTSLQVQILKKFPSRFDQWDLLLLTKLMTLTDPTFLGASNRKVMDILSHWKPFLDLRNTKSVGIHSAIFLSQRGIWRNTKLQRIGASFLSCSKQLWILLEIVFIHKCLENWDPKNQKDSQLFLHFKRLAKLPGIFCLDFSWSWATGS